jgi:chemotaxis protein MotB
MREKITKIVCIATTAIFLSGCAIVIQNGRRSDAEKIEELSSQLDDLTQAKEILEKRLAQEIKDKDVSLKMMEKGLVITFVADILFDSGKEKIKQEAYPVLNKVATVLKENVPDLKVGIEGYTDNQPIKLSHWRSNWELSSARALSVLHYFSDKEAIAQERLSAIGNGENMPVASNDTPEGRRLNRRVEVVILPKIQKIKEIKTKNESSVPQTQSKGSPTGESPIESQENLK